MPACNTAPTRLACASLAIACLAACGQLPVRDCPTTPVVVEVERRVYVPVPAELTAPAQIAEPVNRSVRELRRVAMERKIAAQDANARLGRIATLAPPEDR